MFNLPPLYLILVKSPVVLTKLHNIFCMDIKSELSSII